MFGKIKSFINRKLSDLRSEHEARLNSFKDPLAKEISWGPVRKTISFGYRNRKLSRSVKDNAVFYPTISATLFPAIFISMGGFLMYTFCDLHFSFFNLVFHPINTLRFIVLQLQNNNSPDLIPGSLCGLTFLVTGMLILIMSIKPLVFNGRQRVFISGFPFLKQKRISFDDIYAIQIISDGGNGADSHMIYELNLVLKSKERVHVFGHPAKNDVQKNGAELSQFLSVPLWDMS